MELTIAVFTYWIGLDLSQFDTQFDKKNLQFGLGRVCKFFCQTRTITCWFGSSQSGPILKKICIKIIEKICDFFILGHVIGLSKPNEIVMIK